jgi:hypothetical protein
MRCSLPVIASRRSRRGNPFLIARREDGLLRYARSDGETRFAGKLTKVFCGAFLQKGDHFLPGIFYK